MGGPGQGWGGAAPEDPLLSTGEKEERAPSRITAGRNLLEWKELGAAPTGTARQRYAEALAEVRRGASEAIHDERIPPGYHDGIRQYFDTLPEKGSPGD